MQGWRLSCGPVPRVSPWAGELSPAGTKHNQLLLDGVFSYLYDPEGNRTARYIDCNANGLLDAGDTAATTYAWDHRNRLTRVTDYATYGDPATRAVDYLYDTENRWIGRDADSDGDGQIDIRTRFAYDGNQIVLQFDRAAAPTGDPADPLTIDHLSHRYLWNPAAVDQLMADEHVTTPDTPGTILWPLADHLGTIRDLAAYDPATATTTVVNHRTFDAYGNLQSHTATTSAHDTLFAFTGRPLDQATDLQNNLHRWYDPAVGRWMSEDPIGFEGRDGNLSAYVGNGPVNATDPSGLAPPIPVTPGDFYNHAIQYAAKNAQRSTVLKWIKPPIDAHALANKTSVGTCDVNSAIALAMGFDLAAWQRGKLRAERKSTDDQRSTVDGTTYVKYAIIDHPTHIVYNYRITFEQTVTVERTLTIRSRAGSRQIVVSSESESRPIFIDAGSITFMK